MRSWTPQGTAALCGWEDGICDMGIASRRSDNVDVVPEFSENWVESID
jgi:hypothetical protein